MFKYVSDVSILSHNIIKEYVKNKNVAIDATLGNGYDCDFLSSCFKKVYAFEIQKEACEKYIDKNNNVIIINESHHKIDKFINEEVDCVCYNLGYLPGGNKEITTLAETSLKSIQLSLNLLSKNGIISIAIYRGHNEGMEEKNCIIKYLKTLPKNSFGVMIHECINRSEKSPLLIIVEKK
ncbi:class I SAM-dependent methyltransferase [Clostridium sp.]|uniref:tRNA (mnm(5)s(2)U34)-methyltransferase n=1 Tax=Clostridium sp. TaxID=1506 RepID=UPI0025BC8D2C|nr:class I SAM-dependent methyltransferase [Clostridium sp.]MCI9304696.1 rRNA methylase [Clostridium sp.]